MNLAKLTDYEVEALHNVYNLSDGHARYKFAGDATQLSKELPNLLLRELDQREVELNFSQVFFKLANQKQFEIQHILYCPSASVSIEIVANYLRMHNLSASLSEPTFDNLADILKRHGVALHPLREDLRTRYVIQEWLETINSDAVFLVAPNNPTGYLFSNQDFQYLVEYCARKQKLLILDFSFRFFARQLLSWDQYGILVDSGVRFIAIEDTGKTWPTSELKVSLLSADGITFRELQEIYRDIFLCISPVTLMIAKAFIEFSENLGFEETVLNIPKTNRELLQQAIAGYPLQIASRPNVPVAWIQIQNQMNDVHIENGLRGHGIYVLPGRHFFWSNPNEASKYIRIALMRDIDLFTRAMNHLRTILPNVFEPQ